MTGETDAEAVAVTTDTVICLRCHLPIDWQTGNGRTIKVEDKIVQKSDMIWNRQLRRLKSVFNIMRQIELYLDGS